ncbi:MAG: hypothetical protein M3Y55_07210 [Pseudomonadota bacterium]|nr:hypothetical protein [Pseudomonadota bacterium]
MLAVVAMFALGACSKPDGNAPSRENFEAGLRTFLADGHDQLCLATYDWPIDLTETEAGANSRHAVQLPVFEKLGLAQSTVVAVPKSSENPDGAIQRYALTDEGRKYYKPHAYKSRDGATHKSDFCVAHISLASVEGWRLDPQDAQHPAATVSYTYRIEPAPWLQDADARRVLPMVAKVIKGADGGLQLHQGFTLGPQGWVAVPGPV